MPQRSAAGDRNLNLFVTSRICNILRCRAKISREEFWEAKDDWVTRKSNPERRGGRIVWDCSAGFCVKDGILRNFVH